MYVAVLIHERNIFHLLFVYKNSIFLRFFFHLKDLVLKYDRKFVGGHNLL